MLAEKPPMPSEIMTHREHGGAVENTGVDMAGGVPYGTISNYRISRFIKSHKMSKDTFKNIL